MKGIKARLYCTVTEKTWNTQCLQSTVRNYVMLSEVETSPERGRRGTLFTQPTDNTLLASLFPLIRRQSRHLPHGGEGLKTVCN